MAGSRGKPAGISADIAGSPTLSVLQGADRGQRFPTTGEPQILGRTGAQVCLHDHTVSRRHAEIRPQNGEWILEDLKSSNGTYLNGVRLHDPVKLKFGDQIRLGGTLLVFGGGDVVERFSGAALTRDLIDLDTGSRNIDSSILSSVQTNDQSAILAAPETADAVHAWNLMYRIAEMIGDVLTVNEFLERVTDVICEHFTVDGAFVLLREARSGEMVPQVLRFRSKDRQSKNRSAVTTSETIIKHVLETKEGVLCANAMTDERFRDDSKHGSIHRLGLRSVLCVPIMAHEEVQGIIHLDCSMAHHTYTHEQLRLATAVGRLSGLAIENIRLLQTRMRTERLAAVGEAAAYLSHHIRNILQGLRSGSDILENGLRRRDVDHIGTAWNMIQRNLDRIYQLTSNLLTFSRDRKPNIEMAQLNTVVQEAVELMQGQADVRQVMLLSDLEDLPPVPLDLEGLHQVTVNLLTNALSAVEQGSGRVVVNTHYDPATNEAILAVRDNGPGVPEDERETIFEPFHSTKGHGGTGLGLAAASKIATELGGRIVLTSNPDEGSTFAVHLPVSPSRTLDSDQTQSPQRKPQA